eukprot:SAG31_NODE_14951_length_778_cov_2.773196_1_plen_132_part_10
MQQQHRWPSLMLAFLVAAAVQVELSVAVPPSHSANLPAFSWQTLPVAWHSSSSISRYTEQQIEELARYQMVTLEKFQNLRAIVPAATLLHDYSSPAGLYACQDNITGNLSRCGCCEEDEIIAVARKIKAVNP